MARTRVHVLGMCCLMLASCRARPAQPWPRAVAGPGGGAPGARGALSDSGRVAPGSVAGNGREKTGGDAAANVPEYVAGNATAKAAGNPVGSSAGSAPGNVAGGKHAADTAAGPDTGKGAGKDVGRLFYHHLPYGSEAQFNPLSQILNEGFDMLRMQGADRHVVRRAGDLAQGLANALRSIARPDITYGRYGWKRALRNEILPLTLDDSQGGGSWVPNYNAHLLGSGMVSERMVEWFQQHGYAHPVTLAYATMMASHLLNESVENWAPSQHYSEDAATDLLIFDQAGFLLSRSGALQRFFGHTLQLTNWPGQPAWMLPDQTLENTGQLYVLRVPLPYMERWRLFHAFGVETLIGVTRDLADGYGVSLAAGVNALRVRDLGGPGGARTVDLAPAGALFLERNGSLLASARSMVGYRYDRWGGDARLGLYLYPGVLRLPGLGSPGLWAQLVDGGGVRLGITPALGLGLGLHP